MSSAPKLVESGTGRGGVGDLVIDVEDVLPGLAMHRPGLHLAKVGVVIGKYLERRDQGSGAVFDRKSNADLVSIPCGTGHATANQEEPGVVRGIVFDTRRKHLAAVGEGCLFAGNGGVLAVPLLNYMLDAAGGVVKGSWRHLSMLAQKSAALG